MDRISSRVDAIEGGMDGMTNNVDKAIQDVNQNWKKIIQTLDKNLLRKRNHPFYAIDRLLNKYGYVRKNSIQRKRKYEEYEEYDSYDYDEQYGDEGEYHYDDFEFDDLY